MLLRYTSIRDLQILQRPLLSKIPYLYSVLQYSDVAVKKGKAAPLQERKMRDRVRLWAKGGEGGNGCWSYRRSRTDRYGKADGGNGGRGGDVILECSAAVWDFRNLQHHLNAKGGGNGTSKNRIGSCGSDKVVQVPVGTVIHLVSGEIPSFVEDTSIKSLKPWEIPESEEVGSSKPIHHSDGVSTYISSTGHSPSARYKFHDGISRTHSKIPKTRDFSETERKENINTSVYQWVKPQEYNEDEYGSELEGEENEDEYYNGKSSRIHSKVPKTRNWSEAEGKENIKNCHYQWTKGQEDKEDIYGSELEGEENEDEYEEDEEEEEEGEEEVQYSVAELTKPGQRILVAQGGDGGLGNVALKNVPRDKISHKIVKRNDESMDLEDFDDNDNGPSLNTGMPGSESVLILELKSIADVGLVGMPNAGKSTLLGAISRAKPTVGHYAFTTLRPNIGNMNYDDFFSVTVADIPGLIKGAHVNRGLGHAFLRHIERTKVLAYVVDLAAGLNGGKGIAPWEQLRDLVMELEYHQEGLSHRPSLVVANKIDEEGAEDVYEELKRRVKGVPIYPICAVLEEGVPELKDGLRRLMDGSELQVLDLYKIMVD